ncbi:MAG: universal stress protein [Pseudomonadota bacterium]
MFRNILVPFDGSVGAEAALDKAVELAKLCDAELNILTVFRHHSMLEASFSMVRASEPGNLDDVMREHASEVADHARQRAIAAGLQKVRAFVRTGQPARTIISFAGEHGNDCIVIGSRGMGSVESYLLGSVSHKVTGLSKVPVLVV